MTTRQLELQVILAAKALISESTFESTAWITAHAKLDDAVNLLFRAEREAERRCHAAGLPRKPPAEN